MDHNCGSMTHCRGPARRNVLRGIAALPLLPACLHQAHFSAGVVRDGRIWVPQEHLGVLKQPTDVLFVRAEGAAGTIALRRHGDGYLALLALCTHRSCELSALPQSYDCPCHGSRFDLNGEVLEGPAEHPLPRLSVLSDRAGITILLPGAAK